MSSVMGETSVEDKRPLPTDWRWVRLGEVCVFEYGASLPSHSRVTGAVPVYGSNGCVGYHNQPLTSGPTIVIGRKGSIGEIHFSPVACWPIDTTYYIERPKLDVDMFWLTQCLRALNLRTLNKAAAVPGLNRDDAYALTIPLPRLAEQQRIVALLSKQLAAVERARTAAEARLEAAGVLPSAYLRAVFGSLEAQQWPRRRLDAVCKIQLGKMLSPKSKTGERPLPYLRNANVQWNRIDLSDVSEMDFSENEEEKFALRPGDLLVCEGGEPGRAAVWQGQIERCCYQKALHRLRPLNNLVDPYFLMYRLWFSTNSAEFLDSHAQTTIAHLPAVRLGALSVGVPLLAEQRQIVARFIEQIAAVEQLRTALEAELAAINALPAALLRRAFSGEL